MSLLSHSTGLGLARLGEKLLAFGVILVASHLYGSEGLGEFFYYFSLACLFLPLLDLGMSKLLLQDWYTKTEDVRREQFGHMLLCKAAITLAAIGIAILSDALVRDAAANPIAVTFAVLAIAFENLALFLRTPSQAQDHWRLEAIVPLLARCLTLALLFALAGPLGLLTSGWQIVLLYALSNFISVLISLPSLRHLKPRFRPTTTRTHWPSLIRRGLPFSLTGVFVMISLHIDSVMLGRYSLEETGLYNAGYRVVLVGIAVSGGAAHALFPRIVRLRETGQSAQAAAMVGNVLRVLLTLAIAGTAGGILVADDLMPLLYGHEFAPAALPFAILCLLLPLGATNNILGHTLEATGQQKTAMWITLRSACFNVIANLMLIPVIGMTGAAITTVCTELASLLQMLHHLHRQNRQGQRHASFAGLWRVAPFAAALAIAFLLIAQHSFWTQIILGTLIVATLLLAFHRFLFSDLLPQNPRLTP